MTAVTAENMRALMECELGRYLVKAMVRSPRQMGTNGHDENEWIEVQFGESQSSFIRA